MKKTYFIIIILISIVFLYGCNKITLTDTNTKNNIDTKKITNNIEEDRLYKNKKEGFSFKMATGLEIQENLNGLLVSIFLPQKQGDIIKENLSINTDSKSNEKTVEEYYSQQKQGIQNYIKDFKEISKEEYNIVKEKGIKVIYQGTLKNNKLQRQQIIFYKNGKFFTITYTATKDTFDEYLDQINNIIKSLSF